MSTTPRPFTRFGQTMVQLLVGAAALTVLAGCGPKKTATPAPVGGGGDDWDPLSRKDGGPDDGLGVTGVFEGDLDPAEVSEVMRRAASSVNACFAAGKVRNRYLVGALSLRVIVAKDGHVREAVVEEADLGDRETERCLVTLAAGLRFPTPRGGEVQMVLPLSFTPAGAGDGLVRRAATPAEATALHEAVEKSCGSPGSGSGYLVTVYVAAEGRPVGAGFASPDMLDATFADCVVVAATALTYDRPAGVADKVTIPGN